MLTACPEVEGRTNLVAAAEDLCCPITLEAFHDPVVAEDGFTYERAAIATWIARTASSPSTGARMGETLVGRARMCTAALMQSLPKHVPCLRAPCGRAESFATDRRLCVLHDSEELAQAAPAERRSGEAL